jgi:excisionase family DNA binding protein
MPKLLYRVEEAADQIGLSRSKVYSLIADGDIETVRIGTSVRIPHDALLRFVDSLHATPADESVRAHDVDPLDAIAS